MISTNESRPTDPAARDRKRPRQLYIPAGFYGGNRIDASHPFLKQISTAGVDNQSGGLSWESP